MYRRAMMTLRPLYAAILLASVAVSSPAAACSPVAGYRAPTNFELARDAEAVILGQVVSGVMNADDPAASTITVRPLEALKGKLPESDFALAGMLLSRDVGRESGGLSNPYEFEQAHPVSYWGACIRYVFPQGTTALFFLKHGSDGAWLPAGGPFSRWAEDVPGEDSPWIELTQFYLSVTELPENERRPALEVERDNQRARAGSPLAQLIAADIERALGTGDTLSASQFEDPVRTESTVQSTLEKMRQAAIEGGN